MTMTTSLDWQGVTPASAPVRRPLSDVASSTPSARTEQVSRTRDLSPAASVAVLRDLAYASALLEGAVRMRSAPDLPSLLSSVAAEAATLIHADDVAVIRYAGIRRTVVDVHVPSHIDDLSLVEAVRAAGQEHWILGSAAAADLTEDPRWTAGRGPLAAMSWRSAMAVPLVSPRPQDQVRLLWFSRTPGAFTSQTAVADLFRRQANIAMKDLDERMHLTLAIAARHQIGQAQGVLMARHHVTADEAFQTLRRESQNTNVKLRTLAEYIISNLS